MQRRTVVTGLAVVAVAVGAGVWWTRGDAPDVAGPGGGAAGKRTVPVITAIVEQGPVDDTLTTIGTAQPVATVAVRARIDSVVEQVHFTEGQEVQAGDLLFTLDDRSLKAELAQAEANQERDRAQLVKSRSDVARYAELVRQNAAPRQQYDTAVASANALEATIKANEAAIETARIGLGYTRIYAPMTARTGEVSVKPGATVRAGDATALVTLTQLRPIHVSFRVAERQLSGVRQAMAQNPVRVTARVPGEEDSPPEQGRMVFLDSQVTQQSGTILAKAEFDNGQTRLWPGQFVDVTVVLRTDPAALTVPVEAVQSSQKGNFVFVVGVDKTVSMRPVTVQRIADGRAVLSAGVQAGEQVVRDGAARLVPGNTVTEANRPPADGAAGSGGS